MAEFCWLIEAPGQNYLYTYSRKFFWTKDAGRALRFHSEDQADAAMMAIRELDAELFAFAKTLGDAKPIEHGFMENSDG